MEQLPFLEARTRNRPQVANGGRATNAPPQHWQALIDVMAERLRQIQQFGHTPEKDVAEFFGSERGQLHLARTAEHYAHRATEDMSLNRREIARKDAVKAAAGYLALIDLLDALDAQPPLTEEPEEP